jgi:hypothetical protein
MAQKGWNYVSSLLRGYWGLTPFGQTWRQAPPGSGVFGDRACWRGSDTAARYSAWGQAPPPASSSASEPTRVRPRRENGAWHHGRLVVRPCRWGQAPPLDIAPRVRLRPLHLVPVSGYAGVGPKKLWSIRLASSPLKPRLLFAFSTMPQGAGILPVSASGFPRRRRPVPGLRRRILQASEWGEFPPPAGFAGKVQKAPPAARTETRG